MEKINRYKFDLSNPEKDLMLKDQQKEDKLWVDVFTLRFTDEKVPVDPDRFEEILLSSAEKSIKRFRGEFGDIDVYASIVTRSDLPGMVGIFCTETEKRKKDFTVVSFDD